MTPELQSFLTFWIFSSVLFIISQAVFRMLEKDEIPLFPSLFLTWVVVLITALQFGGFWK